MFMNKKSFATWKIKKIKKKSSKKAKRTKIREKFKKATLEAGTKYSTAETFNRTFTRSHAYKKYIYGRTFFFFFMGNHEWLGHTNAIK